MSSVPAGDPSLVPTPGAFVSSTAPPDAEVKTAAASPSSTAAPALAVEPQTAKMTGPSGSSHSVSIPVPDKLKRGAEKTAFIATVIILGLLALAFLPITLLAMAVVGGPAYMRMRDITSKIKQNPTLQTASNAMKKAEEVAKFVAMKAAIAPKLAEFTDLKAGLFKEAYVKQLNEKFNEELAAQPPEKHVELREEHEALLKQNDSRLNILSRAYACDNAKERHEALGEFRAKSSSAEGGSKFPDKFLLSPTQTASMKQEVGAHKEVALMQDIVSLLQNAKDDNAAEVNKKFVQLLRAGLTSDAYQQHKLDVPKPLIVKFLQDLSLATYLGVKALGAYKEMGKAILSDMPRAKEGEGKGKTASERFATTLAESHAHAARTMYTDHGVFDRIAYAKSHPDQAMGSMASEGGSSRVAAGMLGGAKAEIYDSHGNLANNPSDQGRTTWSVGEGEVRVQNVYGGSPTIGDDNIYPELLAVLDAIRANNALPADKRDPNIPQKLIYTNFQNLCKAGGEGPRSKTIMLLAQQYPDEFVGVTLPKDSDFYGGKKGAWEGVEDIADFGAKMQEHMLRDADRGLDDRTTTNKGEGFFFAGGRERWEPALGAICDQANEYFGEIEQGLQKRGELTPEAVKELRMAYQEYVYSMIQSYMEVNVGGGLVGPDNSSPYIMTIAACKENIDRGGMENLKKVYTRYIDSGAGTGIEDKSALMGGLFHARALSARDRVVLDYRTTPLLNFMKYVPPQKFRAGQDAVFKKIGQAEVRGHRYVPAE